MLNTEFAPWPSYTEEEIAAVSRVLASNRVNYWTGNEGREFEREFAAFAGADYAVALSNGSVALELALRAVGIGQGDEVIVTARTFVASASCVVNAGGKPIFADVEENSQGLTADTIRPCLSASTRAIVCVHLAGFPCDMDGINALAREHDLVVIEDCAQAHGARYRGQPVGSLGDIATWSFCQDKIMTTAGEGGMVTTNNEEYWRLCWERKDHGKSWARVNEPHDGGGFRWLHDSFGSNHRMTEMQSAIGRLQLLKMDEWQAQRKHNATQLTEALSEFHCIRPTVVPAHIEHAWYKLYAFVKPEALKPDWNRDRIIATIRERGVPCYEGSCSEVYRERCFTDNNLAPAAPLSVARELGETSLMFLVHPTLTPVQIERTRQVIRDVLGQAGR